MRKFTLTILVLLTVLLLQNQCLSAPMLHLPSGSVSATYSYPGSESYWSITLSGVGTGYDVANGIYIGWCVDHDNCINNGSILTVNLYESYDPNLFSYMSTLNRGNYNSGSDYGDWDMVNYLINHKDPAAIGPGVSDVQEAIWFFVDGGYSGTNTVVWDMINDAKANGENYVPGYGEKIAVVLDAGTCRQQTIIEVTNPVPEPGSLLLLGSGLVGLVGYGKLRFRRRKK